MKRIFGGVKDFFGGIYSYFLTFILLISSVFSFFEIIEKPEIKLELDLNPDYFMSDPDFIDSYDIAPEPYIYITSGDPTVEDPTVGIYFEIYHDDDIKIISFEYDEPIENIYK